MKRIAILLSGRVKKIKSFLSLLEKEKNRYDIDVFISINYTFSNFYLKIQELLGPYLKGFNCVKYNLPDNFSNVWLLKYNFVYNTLSCLYNDKYCFKMATEYADKNEFEYDLYLRFRSDIIVDKLPDFNNEEINSVLFCVNPFFKFKLAITSNPNNESINGRFHCYGDMKHNGKYVTNDIAYGNRKNMKIYCSCYDYIFEKNEENKGNYFICFEYSITTYLEDIGVKWNFFDYNYIYMEDRSIEELL